MLEKWSFSRPRRKLDKTTTDLVFMPCLEGVALVAEGLEVVEGVGATVTLGDDVIDIGRRRCATNAQGRAGEGELAKLLP